MLFLVLEPEITMFTLISSDNEEIRVDRKLLEYGTNMFDHYLNQFPDISSWEPPFTAKIISEVISNLKTPYSAVITQPETFELHDYLGSIIVPQFIIYEGSVVELLKYQENFKSGFFIEYLEVTHDDRVSGLLRRYIEKNPQSTFAGITHRWV